MLDKFEEKNDSFIFYIFIELKVDFILVFCIYNKYMDFSMFNLNKILDFFL